MERFSRAKPQRTLFQKDGARGEESNMRSCYLPAPRFIAGLPSAKTLSEHGFNRVRPSEELDGKPLKRSPVEGAWQAKPQMAPTRLIDVGGWRGRPQTARTRPVDVGGWQAKPQMARTRLVDVGGWRVESEPSVSMTLGIETEAGGESHSAIVGQ